METDSLKYLTELEEGEVSDESDVCYTPLQRPGHISIQASHATLAGTNMSKMDDVAEILLESDLSSEDSSSGSDDGVKKLILEETTRRPKKGEKRRFAAQLLGRQGSCKLNLLPKKYNVWSESIQEETLMENMRGCDVTKIKKNDRNVEAYDFSLKHRLNEENSLKRCLGTSSTGDRSDDEYSQNKKRARSIKERLSRRCSRSKSSDHVPRYILSIDVNEEDSAEDIARDIANKLYEEKDVLLLRVVEILGKKVAIELFKETQRVEMDGGMMIMNGQRRRTPGGVFLYLLKTDDKIEDEKKAAIFHEDVRKSAMERKTLQALRRDQKVEELKKRLKMKDKELMPLSNRTDTKIDSPILNTQGNGALSNPPPSPVANNGVENSPEYAVHTINHVNDCCSVKVSNDPGNTSQIVYEDDILDMNYDDMDMI